MNGLVVLSLSLLPAGTVGAAQNGNAGFGVPIYPEAEARPDVARAVEAYYATGMAEDQRLSAGVFETPAPFAKVMDFYGWRMSPHKRGWRQQSKALEHQTLTLTYYRAQIVRDASGEEKDLPEVLEPLLGDRKLSLNEFDSRLRELLDENPGAKVQIVEGVRRIAGDPHGSTVRVMVERPYVDLRSMKLVDKTRILLLKFHGKGLTGTT